MAYCSLSYTVTIHQGLLNMDYYSLYCYKYYGFSIFCIILRITKYGLFQFIVVYLIQALRVPIYMDYYSYNNMDYYKQEDSGDSATCGPIRNQCGNSLAGI